MTTTRWLRQRRISRICLLTVGSRLAKRDSIVLEFPKDYMHPIFLRGARPVAPLVSMLLAAWAFNAHAADLAQARMAYSTQIVRAMKAPQSFAPEQPPAGVAEITYESGKLHLKAWMSALPKTASKAPAVVFLHGGFSFSADDWTTAEDFVRAGYVLLMPQLRAENGGSGNFELFGGELDDALAAGSYLAKLPQIDSKRIFLAGHSVGGSLTMLAAQMNSPYRAAAAYSGYAHLPDWLDHYKKIAPFDLQKEDEIKIRDPYRYADSVKIPLYVLSESQNPTFVATNTDFCKLVAKHSSCVHETIAGSHESMVKPSVAKTIAWFNAMVP